MTAVLERHARSGIARGITIGALEVGGVAVQVGVVANFRRNRDSTRWLVDAAFLVIRSAPVGNDPRVLKWNLQPGSLTLVSRGKEEPISADTGYEFRREDLGAFLRIRHRTGRHPNGTSEMQIALTTAGGTWEISLRTERGLREIDSDTEASDCLLTQWGGAHVETHADDSQLFPETFLNAETI